MVRREGKDMIRLDREMEEILHPMDMGIWKADQQVHPINQHQLAQIAFMADRELCRVTGRTIEAKKDWLSLREQERVAWLQHGPDTGDIRDDLYDAIIGTLKVLQDGQQGQ